MQVVRKIDTAGDGTPPEPWRPSAARDVRDWLIVITIAPFTFLALMSCYTVYISGVWDFRSMVKEVAVSCPSTRELIEMGFIWKGVGKPQVGPR